MSTLVTGFDSLIAAHSERKGSRTLTAAKERPQKVQKF